MGLINLIGTIPACIGLLPGLKEFYLIEMTSQSWEVRCLIIAHLLTRQHCLEIICLWLCEITRCPVYIAYRVFRQHMLHANRPSRLRILEIFIHPNMYSLNERGEYIFKPFLNLFSGCPGSLENFSFNLSKMPLWWPSFAGLRGWDPGKFL